jgi:lipoprotein-anchoring transpeptidase ErfK/SrfK
MRLRIPRKARKETETTAQHPGYGSVPEEPSKRRLRWPLVAVIGFVMFLLCGAFAAYAYDDSHKDEIADGVKIGGVDVGGMTADEAKAALQRRLVRPLQRPLRVTFNKQVYKLPASKLRIHAELDGAIEQALADSQNGGLPGRLVRYVTGGQVNERINPQVAYFEPAVNRFVRHVANHVDREAVDASVSPTATSLNVVPGKPGRKLRDNLLTSQLNAAVATAGAPHRVAARVHSTKPDVTTDQLAAEYPTYLTVSQAEFTVRLWKNLKLVKSYPIAVGQPAYPTPYGLFSVNSKQVDPVWSVPNSPWAGELAGTVVAGGTAENPLVARWIGVTDGVGFHGTNEDYSVGTPASHGCMRMHVSDIIDLYDRVDVGTPVYIG